MTLKENIIKEAIRIMEDTEYSAKCQFITANAWKNVNLSLGIIIAILSTITAGFAFSKYDNLDVYIGILAIIITALTTVQIFLNPAENANLHQKYGTRYNSLRNRARIFSEINIHGKTENEIQTKINQLSNERDELNKESPQIPRWAYKKAKKAIEGGEATYKVDK